MLQTRDLICLKYTNAGKILYEKSKNSPATKNFN